MYSYVDQLVNKHDELLVTISDDASDEVYPQGAKTPNLPCIVDSTRLQSLH